MWLCRVHLCCLELRDEPHTSCAGAHCQVWPDFQALLQLRLCSLYSLTEGLAWDLTRQPVVAAMCKWASRAHAILTANADEVKHQAMTVYRAQFREVHRRTGQVLDYTEQLANSLGHLAAVISQLAALNSNMKVTCSSHGLLIFRLSAIQFCLKDSCSCQLPVLLCHAMDRLSGFLGWLQFALFAGRRSTDRRFLLLQNAFCAAHLPNYVGTSAIFAVDRLDAALAADGATSLQERKKHIGATLHVLRRKACRYDANMLNTTPEHGHLLVRKNAAV